MKQIRLRSLALLLAVVAGWMAPNGVAALIPEPSAREAALGNSHPTLTDDFASSFSNPAGWVALAPVHRYFNLDLRVSGTFWNIINAFQGNDPSALFPIYEGNYLGAGLTGPIDVGYAGGGLGFRLTTVVSIDVLYPNVAVQSIFGFQLGVQAEGGKAWRFDLGGDTALDFGFSVKGFTRELYEGRADAVEFFGLLTNPDYFLDYPYEFTPGIGVDAGLLARFGDRWSAGITFDDLVTVVYHRRYDALRDAQNGLPPTEEGVSVRIPLISIGGSWHPAPFEKPWFRIDGVYLSFRDLLGGLREYPRNYLLGITAGAEFTFWNVLALRLGFAEGLLSTGLGLVFPSFTMDLTFRGEEITNQPGVLSVVDIRFAIAIGSKPGKQWPPPRKE